MARELAAADLRRVLALLALPELRAARTVAAYAALPDEPPTMELLNRLAAADVRILLPVVEKDRRLAWRSYDGRLAAGRSGTLSPTGEPGRLVEADVVVIPAVAVDAAGRRLGRGGGYYDRALAGLAALVAPTGPGSRLTPPFVVALLHDDEVVDRLPIEAHDCAVAAVVTECRVLRFG